MTFLHQMMVSLLVVVFVGAVLELMLPSGSIAGYLRMAVGIFVLGILLQPLLMLSERPTDDWPELDFWRQSWDTTQYQAIYDRHLEALEQQLEVTGNELDTAGKTETADAAAGSHGSVGHSAADAW